MLSMIAAAALSITSPFVATFQGVDANYGRTPWERWSFVVSNTTEVEQTLRICPKDIDRVALDPARTTKHAFALSLGEEDWSFGCIETKLSSGESVDLRAYTRPYGLVNSGRTLVLHSSDGALIPATS